MVQAANNSVNVNVQGVELRRYACLVGAAAMCFFERLASLRSIISTFHEVGN